MNYTSFDYTVFLLVSRLTGEEYVHLEFYYLKGVFPLCQYKYKDEIFP